MRRLLAATLLAFTGCAGVRPPPFPMPPQEASLLPPQPANGSLWHAELAANYAFLDTRAHFPGDLLTVVIAEASQGKKDAATAGSASSSISASVDSFFGIPAAAVKLLPSGFDPTSIVSATSARDTKNDGTTTRDGQLSGTITVRVMSVDRSGNMYVQGDKIVAVNGEDQYIVLTGTVRGDDIASDNSVQSIRIADARIDYYGRGVVGDKQHVPLVHRLFDWVWPF
jgi:flagellar L-ring protein precursor FlgH